MNNSIAKKESSKNGLIELFRFLCSVWVAYFHGFFPVLSDKFNGENISVDFFFMVSGDFFLKSMDKYREAPLGEGIKAIFWSRNKKIIVPLTIAALSILYCNIAFPLEFNGFNWPLSFLWFFAAQFVYLSLLFMIYKNVKRRSTFNIICAIIACACISLCMFDLKQFYRVARGPGMIAIGILVSQIPKIKLKSERISMLVNSLAFVISAAAFIYLAYLPGADTGRAHLFLCVVCPALLYFATALPVRSKFLNLLGEFSVFIYLAQLPILLHHFYVSRDTRDQFPLLCICALGMFIINRIVNKIQQNKTAKR